MLKTQFYFGNLTIKNYLDSIVKIVHVFSVIRQTIHTTHTFRDPYFVLFTLFSIKKSNDFFVISISLKIGSYN